MSRNSNEKIKHKYKEEKNMGNGDAYNEALRQTVEPIFH